MKKASIVARGHAPDDQISKIPREAKQAHNYVPPTEQRAVIYRLLWTILLIGSYISCGSSISSSSIPLCWMPSGFATRELVGGGGLMGNDVIY